MLCCSECGRSISEGRLCEPCKAIEAAEIEAAKPIDWQSRALAAEKQISGIAKAVNWATEYQKSLAERVEQVVTSLEHFQERTLTAEAEVERLREEVERLRAELEKTQIKLMPAVKRDVVYHED